MGWLTEPLSYGFMQRALLAGLLAVVAASTVGTWVVTRRLAFMGDALAHGVVPGIALALLVGFDPSLGAAAGIQREVGSPVPGPSLQRESVTIES